MKTKAILYSQHIEVATVPLNEIEYIYAQYITDENADEPIRVDMTDGTKYACDELEFI